MTTPFLPLLSLALLAGAAPAIAAPTVATTTGTGTAQCPGATFDAFLAAFTESRDVQQANTTVPLIWLTIDAEEEPEPRPVTRMLEADELRFPVMPDRAARQRENLTLDTRKTGEAIQVKLSQSDTGYQVFYTFRPKGSCWSLVEVNNESL